MFSIKTPQIVQLLGEPNADGSSAEPHGAVTFQHAHDDVSECQMVVTSKDRSWIYNFNVGGELISTAYEDDATREAKRKAEEDAKAQAELDAEEAAKSTKAKAA